ncbi:MAG: prepilin-type N-terminal cleavage/methylation domain-containing protein [Suilimivivens sp.]
MKNKDRGFTLVELVVCFVILLMLASISIVGVLAYQDYADFKRQNSYAQTLFVAAQSKLTDYSVRGEMDKLEGASKTPLLLDTITAPSGKPASETEDGKNAKEDTIYCLTGTKETYEKYLAGEYQGRTDAEGKSYQALYDIFDEYLMDKSVLSASIALEYNKEKGLVYAVLYSDRNGSFTYTASNKNGRVNICNRQEDYRSEYLIGYYGLD